MKKRARINLEPNLDPEQTNEDEINAADQTELPSAEGAVTASDRTAGQDSIIRNVMPKSTILKTILIGLTVTALVLVWKKKRR